MYWGFHNLKSLFCMWYEVETWQVLRVAFLSHKKWYLDDVVFSSLRGKVAEVIGMRRPVNSCYVCKSWSIKPVLVIDDDDDDGDDDDIYFLALRTIYKI